MLAKINKRRSTGISLMYVIVVGGVTASAAIALGASLFPAIKHVSTLAVRNEVIDIAEGCAEYALRKMNNLGQSEELQLVEASKLIPPDAVSRKASISVALNKAELSKLIEANLYQGSKYQISKEFSSFDPSFRFLTVSAAKGGYKHSIRLILAPVYIPLNGIGTNQSPATPPNPLFSSALQSNQTLNIGNSIKIGMEDGTKLGADVNGNGLIQLGANAQIGGQLNAFTPTTGGTTPTSIKASSDNVTVNGNVKSSGNIVDIDGGSTPPLISDAAGGTVLGDGNNGLPVFGSTDGTAAQTYSPGIDVPPSTDFAQVSYSGTDPTGFSMPDSATVKSVSDLGTLTVKAGTTVTIEPGVYVADSITVEPGGNLKITSSADSSFSGVDLFVQGNGSDSSPINIQGNVSFDSSAAQSANNFQMFYGGSKNVNFSLPNSSNFHGLVYAPNASMGISFGTNSNFHGAAVAKDLSLALRAGASNGSFLFNQNATSTTAPSATVAAGPNYSLLKSQAGAEPWVRSFRVVSWQDLPNQ